MEITKEHINYCKLKDKQALSNLLQSNISYKDILFVLQNLGHLPDSFDDTYILPLLLNKNDKIRFWAVKTLSKIKGIKNLDVLTKIGLNDESTIVRREAVSAIGRMRNQVIIPTLMTFLNDDDPKIVLQSIRGLLTFKTNTKVKSALKALSKHPNEIVQKVIEKEFFSQTQEKIIKQPHSAVCSFLKNTIVLGDVREILQLVPDESFHLTFTSPPYYNARDYSIYKSYHEYLHFLKEVFSLVYAKTKEGRFLIVNTSPIIIPRISRQHSSKRYPIPFDVHYFLVNMGWEFIDDIVWEKPESSVKNRNAGFLQHRKPLAYKPNAVTEYVMVYRKKTDKLIDWNIRQYDSAIVNESKVKDGYETSNIWKIDPKHNKVHSAIFPIELCKRIIEYYSFKRDLVFDPFAGSGTFGRVAKNLDRLFFLTEKEPKYFNYMKQFLSQEQTLFSKDELQSTFLTLDEYRKAINK